MFGKAAATAATSAASPPPPEESFEQATARQAREHSAKQLQAAGASAAMGADAWNRLNDSQRLALRLSLALAERDPDLAATLRALAAESVKTGLSCPRCEWWHGLGIF